MFLPGRYLAKGGGNLAECKGDSSRGELEDIMNLQGNPGLTVGKASKQVARAAHPGSSGTRVAPGNYGISEGTQGAVGLCSRGVSLIPKEIGRHRGKNQTGFSLKVPHRPSLIPL